MEELDKPTTSRQRLIHSGKILKDDQVISSTEIKEGDFIVLMITNIASTTKAASSNNSGNQTNSTMATGNASISTFSSSVDANNSSKMNLQSSGMDSNMILTTGPEYEAAINRLVEMGFEREESIKAMRAGFNNPDRAVEYLTNGLPSSFSKEQESTDTFSIMDKKTKSGGDNHAAAIAVSGGIDGGDGNAVDFTEESSNEEEKDEGEGEGEGEEVNPLAFLQSDPQVRQLRAAVQQNPALLQPILQQIAQTNPEILSIIEENRSDFVRWLNEDTDKYPDDYDENEVMGGELNEEASGVEVLHVSETERESLARLESLGFDKRRVIEAFFACDKNEELAANFLFDHINDDEQL